MVDLNRLIKILDESSDIYGGPSGTDETGDHDDYVHGDYRKPSNKGVGAEEGFVGEDEHKPTDSDTEAEDGSDIENEKPSGITVEMLSKLLFDNDQDLSMGRIALRKLMKNEPLNLRERNTIVTAFNKILPMLKDRRMFRHVRNYFFEQ